MARKMKLYKKIYFFSLSIAALLFAGISATQFLQKYNDRCDLELYYARELESLYTKFYELDHNGFPILPQSHFEAARDKLEEQMLVDGFNRERIRKMEDAGRSKGSERRRFWDELQQQSKDKDQKSRYRLRSE